MGINIFQKNYYYEAEKRLEVLMEINVASAISDLCVLTGAFCYDYSWNVNFDASLKGRISNFWTRGFYKSKYKSQEDYVGTVKTYYCKEEFCDKTSRHATIRPIIVSENLLEQIPKENYEDFYFDTFCSVPIVKFGEYPQFVPCNEIQQILEMSYKNNKLIKAGKTYTFDSSKVHDNNSPFIPITYEEYEYDCKKYVRIQANSFYENRKFELTNHELYKNGDYVWVEVLPVRWLKDEKTGTLISLISLVSGIRFMDNKRKYNGNFNETEVYSFLNNYMLKDLFQGYKLNNNLDDNILNNESVKKLTKKIINKVKIKLR